MIQATQQRRLSPLICSRASLLSESSDWMH
jgi:hypothetical protein